MVHSHPHLLLTSEKLAETVMNVRIPVQNTLQAMLVAAKAACTGLPFAFVPFGPGLSLGSHSEGDYEFDYTHVPHTYRLEFTAVQDRESDDDAEPPAVFMGRCDSSGNLARIHAHVTSFVFCMNVPITVMRAQGTMLYTKNAGMWESMSGNDSSPNASSEIRAKVFSVGKDIIMNIGVTKWRLLPS